MGLLDESVTPSASIVTSELGIKEPFLLKFVCYLATSYFSRHQRHLTGHLIYAA